MNAPAGSVVALVVGILAVLIGGGVRGLWREDRRAARRMERIRRMMLFAAFALAGCGCPTAPEKVGLCEVPLDRQPVECDR